MRIRRTAAKHAETAHVPSRTKPARWWMAPALVLSTLLAMAVNDGRSARADAACPAATPGTGRQTTATPCPPPPAATVLAQQRAGGRTSSAATQRGAAVSAPGQPENLRIDTVGATSMDVHWQDGTGEDTYILAWQRNRDPGTLGFIFLPPNIEVYTLTSLGAGTTVDVWLAACAVNQCSGWAGAVTAVTGGGSTPQPVQNLRVVLQEVDKLGFEWTLPADPSRTNVDAYYTLRWPNGAVSHDFIHQGATFIGVSFESLGFLGGASMELMVRACNHALCTGWAGPVRGVTQALNPLPVPQIGVTIGGLSYINFNWSYPDSTDPEIDHFLLAYSGNNGQDWQVGSLPPSDRYTEITNLPSDTVFYLALAACYAAFCSDWDVRVQSTVGLSAAAVAMSTDRRHAARGSVRPPAAATLTGANAPKARAAITITPKWQNRAAPVPAATAAASPPRRR